MYIDKFLLWTWTNIKQIILWLTWILVTIVLIVYLTNSLLGQDKSDFLPGESSHGHYQIEMACEACHTTFEGVKQETCLECHGAELEAVDDSHPDHKFADPRNAELLSLIDAQKCITCHVEHRPGMTRPMAVTVPPDYCIYCHEDVAEERPSHEGMPFDTCRGACHNYHDNKALYEDFLVKNLHQADTYDKPVTIERNFLEIYRLNPKYPVKRLTMKEQDAPEGVDLEKGQDWEDSSHANAGVNCMACHAGSEGQVWVDKPDHSGCQDCHDLEVSGFIAGRHGMRLAEGLSPMTTDMARQPMRADAHKELNCMSCHKAHQYSTDQRHTAVDACLKCHADDHSRAYKGSSHFRLWNDEQNGKMPKGSGISCATCHLPREVIEKKGKKRTVVQHNQNLNLRPRQKMARGVCMNCHGLEFTLDALADEELMQNNYSDSPSVHIESLEMAEKRLDYELSIDDVTVTEGDTATVEVNLNHPGGTRVTVEVATADGTAVAGSDYVAIPSTILSFAPGETRKTLIIINSDVLDEGASEQFFVNLSNPVNATIVDKQAVVTITDDDEPPMFSVNDVTVKEGDSAEFTVSLSAASGLTTSVEYATFEDNATENSDYIPVKSTLTFAPGEMSKTVSISVKGDTLDEEDERFFVNLSNPVNATIVDKQAVVTITDDDDPPTISIDDVTL